MAFDIDPLPVSEPISDDTIKTATAVISTPPLGDIDAYLHAIHNIPLLTAFEERQLAQRWHDHRDIKAAQQLTVSTLRFTAFIAHGYLGYGLPYADLIQEGNIGLMKAVHRFNPGCGVRLIAYAVHWIRAEIHKFVICNWRLVKMATTKAQRKLFFNLRRMSRDKDTLDIAGAAAIADELKVTTRDIHHMQARFAGQEVSFGASMDQDTYGWAPEDYLADQEPGPLERIEAEDWTAKMHPRLDAALESLDIRSRDIVRSRLLTEGPAVGLLELSRKYRISMERVRQIQKKALDRMRDMLAGDATNAATPYIPGLFS